MADLSADARRQAAKDGKAMSDGSYPIRNVDELQAAIRLAGRAKGGAKGAAMVRRFIMKRARALGRQDLIPDNWNPDGTLKSKNG